jgi:hypothetical protein
VATGFGDDGGGNCDELDAFAEESGDRFAGGARIPLHHSFQFFSVSAFVFGTLPPLVAGCFPRPDGPYALIEPAVRQLDCWAGSGCGLVLTAQTAVLAIGNSLRPRELSGIVG